MKTLSTGSTHKVENYPYGYTLKTDKYYSIEFRKGKGFRLVGQTLNPKTKELNKPKKSIYHPCMLMTVSDEGKVNSHVEDFYDDKGKDRGSKFMFDNFNFFLPEERKDIAAYVIMVLKTDIYAKATYCGSDTKKLLPLYEEAIKTLIKIFKDDENLWDNINLDWKAIEALEIKGYKPFVRVS